MLVVSSMGYGTTTSAFSGVVHFPVLIALAIFAGQHSVQLKRNVDEP
jgi:hypothetical protein